MAHLAAANRDGEARWVHSMAHLAAANRSQGIYAAFQRPDAMCAGMRLTRAPERPSHYAADFAAWCCGPRLRGPSGALVGMFDRALLAR
jgi:hypothetical protein